MASGRDTTVATVDIVCETLQAKLHTKDLSSGSSLCVLFGSRLLTPCEFQRLAGTLKRWKGFRKELENYNSIFGPTFITFPGVIHGR